MADVHDEVRRWLHSQQDWLQEAADRVIQQGTLDDDDINDLCERLKTVDGRKVTSHREFNGFGGPVTTASTLRLVSIGEIQGIENLAPRRPLEFSNGNLAVIYGNTGSGKSSYTRILKKICGKPRAQYIRSNVFQPSPEVRQCVINFSVNDDSHSVTWPANDNSIDELRSVDIFDGDDAGFYLSDETEVTYAPPLLTLFAKLVEACKRVERKLQQEQQQLSTKLPSLPPEYINTTAGKIYRALSSVMQEASISVIVDWSDENQKSLDQFVERLKAAAPAEIARQKRVRAQQVVRIQAAITSAATAVSEQACKQLQEKNRFAKEKRRQAIEAVKINLESAKLEGIGTDTWIVLWNAAKDYSVNSAYPGIAFPVTDDARCVLCHQSLDAEAKTRLQDFERYVQGKIEAEAKQAEDVYSQSIESLPVSPQLEQIQSNCQAAGLDEALLKLITEFWHEFNEVRDICTTAASDDEIKGLTAPSDLEASLKVLSDSLEEEATQYDTDAKAFDRVETTRKKTELEAKRWTAQQAEAIREEVERLGIVREFECWKGFTNTRNISIKAGVIFQKIITDAYVSRFNDELKALGASRIKVELIRTRTEHGKAKHRIQLCGATAGNATPKNVLSDGERRVVALAAFLADVTGKTHAVPFVFDDPISSLDHDFEWDVAVRLARLAQDRQVIVFTHRLSLYGAIEDAARKSGEDWKRDNLVQRCIEAFCGTAGHPVDDAVWNANTKKANNILLDRLNEAKKYFDAGDSTNYRIHAQGICTDFRKLLERTVEEDLLNTIVKRHRRSVTTDNRIIHLPKITREDCDFIDTLITKYSSYEHSQSHETPVFLPDEPKLRQDLEALKTWREDFRKRPIEDAAFSSRKSKI